MDQLFSKAVGIDLGTTNSAVAVMNRTDTDVIIHEARHATTTPSCVWKDPRSGEIVVGRMAFRRIGTTPEPIRSIKRLMGHQTTVQVTDEQMSPEQVSAAILGEMKRQIEQDVAGWNTSSRSWLVDRAVVTVPAYFDHPSIEATRKAAELAGLDVLDLLHEPTAAAVHHCWSTKTTDGTFLVYDLGGGTFDVSIVRCTAGAFEVLGISGNNMLGGDNIDIEMAARLQEYLAEDGYAFDLDLADDPEDRIRFGQLKFLAEGAKQALSTKDDFMFRDTGTIRDKDGTPVTIDRIVERSEFEAVARPLIERTIGYCHEAVALATKEAGITLADVDQVILAGGSTHIPLVRELVTSELCGPTGAKCAEPVYEKVDTVVALGAAIRAAESGGLSIANRQRSIRVSFRGTGATRRTDARAAGTVEALTDEHDLTGGRIHLTTDGYDDETELGPNGVFAFTGIPIQPDAESQLSFEVFDGADNLVMSLDRSVTHKQDVGPIGPSTSSPPLSKAFVLEVNRGGRSYLKELLPALATLPADATFTFNHPGNTEMVLFPLYQRKRKIQVISVPVPSTTPRGTVIKFNVRVDRLQMITIKGSIGDTEFSVLVDPPPEREMPTAEEIEALVAQFRDATQYLKPGDRAVVEAGWDQIMTSLAAAVARGDQMQAVHEIEELEVILAEVPNSEGVLEPPKEEFDQLVDDCRVINVEVSHAARSANIPHDQQEMARSIDAQSEHGERAFRNRDQTAYAEAIQMLDRIRQYLVGIYRQTERGNDSRTDGERAVSQARNTAAAAVEIMRLAEAAGRADFQQEVVVIQRRLVELERDAERDPQRAQRTTSQLAARLAQIRSVLTPKAGAGHLTNLPEELS
jgi:molecular chaperone DnaK